MDECFVLVEHTRFHGVSHGRVRDRLEHASTALTHEHHAAVAHVEAAHTVGAHVGNGDRAASPHLQRGQRLVCALDGREHALAQRALGLGERLEERVDHDLGGTLCSRQATGPIGQHEQHAIVATQRDDGAAVLVAACAMRGPAGPRDDLTLRKCEGDGAFGVAGDQAPGLDLHLTPPARQAFTFGMTAR